MSYYHLSNNRYYNYNEQVDTFYIRSILNDTNVRYQMVKSEYLSTEERYHCPVEATMDVLGGKWKLLIIHHLLEGTKRFNELQKAMPKVTQRMLTAKLRELESHGIINRKVYAVVPPKVEYSMTEFGRTVEPMLWVMDAWGKTFIEGGNF